jgi:hypothetical protein
LPVEIGRNGPVTGRYWRGKIDDVRIWNIARTDADIAGTFSTELPAVRAGLIANWKFNEPLHTFLAYTATGNNHTAVLSTNGASFSADVHH